MRFKSVGALLAIGMAVSGAALAQHPLVVLQNFAPSDGAAISGSLLRVDHSLYGTLDGNPGYVYRLTPPEQGQTVWTRENLGTFSGTASPTGSLIRDAHGGLVGVTLLGGSGSNGTVFRLRRPASGQTKWSESLLHEFGGKGPGYPQWGVIADSSGVLYGTTISGNPIANEAGTIFSLSPPTPTRHHWRLDELHMFGIGSDGNSPSSGLVADTRGVLYGVTSQGGAHGHGVVFALTPPAGGQTQWIETVLWAFSDGSDGAYPEGNLILDADGALYGTALEGGAYGEGVVFELVPPPEGQVEWQEVVLHSFAGSDGLYPQYGVIMGRDGALFGVAALGGKYNEGTVFKLGPPKVGKSLRFETILHDFTGGADGGEPAQGLALDGKGGLFGTTVFGGTSNHGVVYKIER